MHNQTSNRRLSGFRSSLLRLFLSGQPCPIHPCAFVLSPWNTMSWIQLNLCGLLERFLLLIIAPWENLTGYNTATAQSCYLLSKFEIIFKVHYLLFVGSHIYHIGWDLSSYRVEKLGHWGASGLVNTWRSWESVPPLSRRGPRSPAPHSSPWPLHLLIRLLLS